uniref:Fucosyltransferase n=1 Tax=Kalanchoe fedtschenkoi TaxID=63787 RepID=A0A7N0T3B6_KALFE
MGVTTSQRRSAHDDPPLPVSTPHAASATKRRWSSLTAICVALVVVAEIAFLARLDVAGKSLIVDSWVDFIRFAPARTKEDLGFQGLSGDKLSEDESCEAWLEREDAVVYSRDFSKQPVLVADASQEFKSCAVGCVFRYDEPEKADAAFGLKKAPKKVLRSMESAVYYAENNLEEARRRGYDVVMTTSLSSDVPVGYFSWSEYDIMAPVLPKTEKSLAAAFISNCAGNNFRLAALEALEKANVSIDSYGSCHRNRDGDVNKVEALKRYIFSLAFENSNEEDYVTEKFFQSLVAGTVPVVIGAPNIQEFAPARGSILHIKTLEDVASVAKTMQFLASNPAEFNNSLRWKYEGPSDSFKALLDMAAVHSSCRLCIHLATQIREKEETDPGLKQRPCKCTRGAETVYHVYVRERGGFEFKSVFLRSDKLTLEAFESAVLEKFMSAKHVPNWKKERPESIRGPDHDYRVYRIYPAGMTQRQALYTFRFGHDADLRAHIESRPCAQFEVIFV